MDLILAVKASKTNNPVTKKGDNATTHQNIKETEAKRSVAKGVKTTPKRSAPKTSNPKNQRPDKINSAKGLTPSELTKRVYNRITEEFNFDPLARACSIAAGENQGVPHPFTKELRKVCIKMKADIRAGIPVTEENLDDLYAYGQRAMADAPFSPELQSKHIIDLLQYCYAKLRAVDPAGVGMADILESMGQLKPIDKDTMQKFRLIFETEF